MFSPELSPGYLLKYCLSLLIDYTESDFVVKWLLREKNIFSIENATFFVIRGFLQENKLLSTAAFKDQRSIQ